MAKKKKGRKASHRWKIYVPKTSEPPPLPISRKKALEAVIARWLLEQYGWMIERTGTGDSVMFLQGMAKGLDPNWKRIFHAEYGFSAFITAAQTKRTLSKTRRVLNRRGSIDAIAILMDWMKESRPRRRKKKKAK